MRRGEDSSKPRSRLWRGEFRALLEREGGELKNTWPVESSVTQAVNYARMQICSKAIDGDTGNIM